MKKYKQKLDQYEILKVEEQLNHNKRVQQKALRFATFSDTKSDRVTDTNVKGGKA